MAQDISRLFPGMPLFVRELYRLACEIEETTYAGAPCQKSLEPVGEDYRGVCRRISDSAITYTATLSVDWAP